MAVITDLMQSYDQSTVNDYTIAEGIHMISPTDTPLQLLLPKVQVGSAKAEWIEDELTGQATTLAATVASTTETEITAASGDGDDKFPPDVDTYNVVIRVDQEYMLVTGKSGDVLTVTRGYGSTTESTHASGAVVHIISQMEQGVKTLRVLRTILEVVLMSLAVTGAGIYRRVCVTKACTMTMQPSTIAAIVIAVVTTLLVAVYLVRHRHHPPDIYVPKAAWLRAGIYFCACYLVAIATGVFGALLSNPIATPEQIADPAWWSWIVGLALLVTAAYWVIWARWTPIARIHRGSMFSKVRAG